MLLTNDLAYFVFLLVDKETAFYKIGPSFSFNDSNVDNDVDNDNDAPKNFATNDAEDDLDDKPTDYSLRFQVSMLKYFRIRH